MAREIRTIIIWKLNLKNTEKKQEKHTNEGFMQAPIYIPR